MIPTRASALACAAATCMLPSPALSQVSFTPVGDLAGGGTFSRVWAVSGDGRKAVGASGSTSSGVMDDAFTFYRPTPGSIHTLGDLPGGLYQSSATGVNQDGTAIVGSSVYGPDGRTHAFRWSSSVVGGLLTDLGNMHAIDPLPPEYDISAAYAVSDDGKHIVGQGMNPWTLAPEACGWSIEDHGDRVTGCYAIYNIPGATGPNIAYGISGNGLVNVGESPTAAGPVAWRHTWIAGVVVLGEASGGIVGSSARAANTTGSLIVGYCTTAQGREAALWRGDPGFQNLPYTLQPIGDLPGGEVSAIANACSADGQVVVGASDAGRKIEPEPGVQITSTDAFVWDTRHGMRKLSDLLGAALPAGWFLETATGISDDGTVIGGTGLNPAGNVEGFLVTVPRFCIADINDNGSVSVQDVFDFLAGYFSNSPVADINEDNTVTAQDVFDFLAAYFACR